MRDLISRQAAIQWVKTECNPYGKPTLEFESGKKVIEHLKQMPSAQLERKKGKWITTDDGWDGEYFVCSVCGCPWTLIEGNPEDNGMNFCPNCGADMRGKQDEH